MENIKVEVRTPNLNLSLNIQKVQNLDKLQLKSLKHLCRKMTGEKLIMKDEDEIVMGVITNKRSGIVCFCNISMNSPGNHFENEKNARVPYLYNYICDAFYRRYKISYQMMDYIKKLYNSQKSYENINLDILGDNIIAKKFFEKNGFVFVNDFNAGGKKILAYTCGPQTSQTTAQIGNR